ncbi:YajD family HNH nuclease [Ectothiorhodospira haloalkaliphila]|nr:MULTISPECIES: YajD family HNH nuclease [Ectothiorhodospira]MCG5494175.1 YajD family HNH nuclease [Ectothiorhodospira variabilis]MCG5497406.1 YajD family HNH nuclease [Ectothiorhodospira variabilis]MCG5503295.1 YajD family HNH nuclease [Ectothiorhodospira variabilis]MCG5506617.1 YajD family HNH nuclease [Ectothiorhodospira variabilis]MCG5524171.1 YajD family HNH nuclease [Ectothiorhodospira haloalkaliphila]
MAVNSSGGGRLDQVVANSHREREDREKGYRAKALKMYPWVCGRCGRTFDHKNVRELTVHHRDHNHDNNPPDGSNWELLCVYCHDNEHQRLTEAMSGHGGGQGDGPGQGATHNPFAALGDLLKGQGGGNRGD